MNVIVCNVSGCIYNDGEGNCKCNDIYISDVDSGEPRCESAKFSEDD